MSQAKVDRYKEEKANRKKIMRKEKIANRLRKQQHLLCGSDILLTICMSPADR